MILGHARRKILHLNVTQHPTAGWPSRQITEAFPWDTAPRYLLRDRDTSYGGCFQKRAILGLRFLASSPLLLPRESIRPRFFSAKVRSRADTLIASFNSLMSREISLLIKIISLFRILGNSGKKHRWILRFSDRSELQIRPKSMYFPVFSL